MKLAILGADPTTLALTKAAVERADLEVAYLCELDQASDPRAAELQSTIARSAKRLNNWEDLLDPRFVDGIIVGRAVDEERRSEQLRKLAQLGIPVLMSHPVVDSMLLYYELNMIRRDTDAKIVPALGDRLHPTIRELTSMIRQGDQSPIGKIDSVTIERQLKDRGKRTVLTHFARDVDLLRVLCGELNQIGAMGTSGEDSAFGNLSVQLTGPDGLFARWAVIPVAEDPSERGQLVMTGSIGKVSVDLSDMNRGYTISTTDAPVVRESSAWKSEQVLLDSFVATVAGTPSGPDLLDAARAMELTETIGRSLARRRTIDLHFEEHSEENTFKGKMAAGGCLLLMLGLGLLFLVAILDKANIPGARFWPWLLAGLFGIFSLLQLLALTFKK